MKRNIYGVLLPCNDYWTELNFFCQLFICGIGSSSFGQSLDQPYRIPREASVEIKPTKGPLEVIYY